MSLSGTIPIQNLVFTSTSLQLLLSELGKYHVHREGSSGSSYWLSVSENETTTYSSDSPPADLGSMLDRPVTRLLLRIDSYKPTVHFEITLHHGFGAELNSLRLDSEDHDLVNAAHTNLSTVLSRVTPQSTFLRRYVGYLLVPFSILLGWPLKTLLLLVLKWFGQTQSVPWSFALMGQYTIIALATGVFPASALLKYAVDAYPSVEIKAGPPHLWKEARRQKWMGIIFAVLVLGPSGSFLYDVYKFFLKG